MEYMGGTAENQTVKMVNGDVFSVGMGVVGINYYHFIAEGLARLVLTLKTMPKHAKLLLADTAFWHEMVDDVLPGVEMEMAMEMEMVLSNIIWYKSGPLESRGGASPHRYHFQRLFIIDWRDPIGQDVIGPVQDSWRAFQPPKVGIVLAREMMLSRLVRRHHRYHHRHHHHIAHPQQATMNAPNQKKPKIIYVPRPDRLTRKVLHEGLLSPSPSLSQFPFDHLHHHPARHTPVHILV